MTDARQIVRTIIEECWSDDAGLERMRALVSRDYVHHTPMGDWTFEQFAAGLRWVDSLIAGRTYRVEHLLAEDGMFAALLSWHGTRREDESVIDGRGAYHCRIADGVVAEDWDVFFPMP